MATSFVLPPTKVFRYIKGKQKKSDHDGHQDRLSFQLLIIVLPACLYP